MKWYYKILGGHTHVRVFMNGGKCGDLCFRNEEFDEVRKKTDGPYGHYAIEFVEEQREESMLRRTLGWTTNAETADRR